MAHLQKSSVTGHLLKTASGHLSKTCAGCTCAGCSCDSQGDPVATVDPEDCLCTFLEAPLSGTYNFAGHTDYSPCCYFWFTHETYPLIMLSLVYCKSTEKWHAIVFQQLPRFYFGDPYGETCSSCYGNTAAAQGRYKDVTGDVSCVDGQLEGNFTLDALDDCDVNCATLTITL